MEEKAMVKNITLKALVLLAVIALLAGMMLMLSTGSVYADEEGEAVSAESNTLSTKAIAAAAVVGIAGTAGAIFMGLSIMKSVDSTARQPEAAGNIRTTMMLGLVFIETVVIYALIVAILVIFVL
ncbi:MAG: ATP synthase F0 subunit C [Firmicutes bacterium]|nr:ATP synthase F0 subunit C [Bacillota bacterium]